MDSIRTNAIYCVCHRCMDKTVGCTCMHPTLHKIQFTLHGEFESLDAHLFISWLNYYSKHWLCLIFFLCGKWSKLLRGVGFTFFFAFHNIATDKRELVHGWIVTQVQYWIKRLIGYFMECDDALIIIIAMCSHNIECSASAAALHYFNW